MDQNKAAKQLKLLQDRAKNKKSSNNAFPTANPGPAKTFVLDWTDKLFSKEEIFSEYLQFLRGLPSFLHAEREKIVRLVEKKLKISEIQNSMEHFNVNSLLSIKEGGDIIDELSAKLGQSLRYSNRVVMYYLNVSNQCYYFQNSRPSSDMLSAV